MLHCGPSLPGPLLPSYRLPKVCDLLSMEQGLPPGYASAKSTMSAVLVRRAAANRCCCVGAAGCSTAGSCAGAGSAVWILPPREGGFHDRWSDCTDSCHGEAAFLVTRCAVEPTISCGLLYLSVRIAETLAIGND